MDSRGIIPGNKLFKFVLFLSCLCIALGLYLGLKKGFIEDSDTLDVLILGIDSRTGWKARSDSINLLHIDFSKNRMGVLSIPRDTLVDIPGHGRDKINHAHMFGGPELSCKAASKLLNIPIKNYVEFNFPAFMQIVDQMGGITVDVEKPIYYDDYAGGLHIHLQEGKQKLSGYEAMGYVRFRHDARSDWGRIDRQHKFFEALSKQMVSPSSLIKMPLLVYTGTSSIRTNLDPVVLTKLAIRISSIYKYGEVVSGVIPGGDAHLTGGYYMLSDESGKRKEIDRVIYGRE